MIYDVFTYNGEKDITDIHLNVLSPFVDRFIVVEAKTTFSGNKKPLYWSLHEKKFEKFWPKIDYYVIDENYSYDEIELAEKSPNTVGARHWKNEFLQKESIHKALIRSGVQDEDTVYIGDADEIWEPYEPTHPAKLKMMVYAYYLNNRSNEEFWGTLVSKYKDIKGKCLNHLRTEKNLRTLNYYGWHFTSMGGLQAVRRKLNDSYTPESYNTYEVQEHLLKRLAEGKDYLGRDFKFWYDEDDWPQFLVKYRYNYSRLCLHTSLK